MGSERWQDRRGKQANDFPSLWASCTYSRLRRRRVSSDRQPMFASQYHSALDIALRLSVSSSATRARHSIAATAWEGFHGNRGILHGSLMEMGLFLTAI